jgi:hypothetical protein
MMKPGDEGHISRSDRSAEHRKWPLGVTDDEVESLTTKKRSQRPARAKNGERASRADTIENVDGSVKPAQLRAEAPFEAHGEMRLHLWNQLTAACKRNLESLDSTEEIPAADVENANAHGDCPGTFSQSEQASKSHGMYEYASSDRTDFGLIVAKLPSCR